MSEEFHLPVAVPSERHDQHVSNDELLKVVLIDQSHDAEDEARDRADARLDAELGEGGRFKKFVNGIWKGNIAKEFYRQRYVHQELATIKEAGDVLVGESSDRRTQALESTIQRFSSDYEELIHDDAGERREVQEQGSQLDQGVKHLIREFVEGRLNATTLREERTRLLNGFREQEGAEAAGKGIATTDNLLEIAQTVAGVVEHGESLDSAMARLQVVTGEARNGARTEARYNAVDSVIDKLGKTKVGSLVNPGTLATVVAGAAAVARVGGQGIAGNVTRALLPGAVAGVWAGLRENKRTKDERAQHAREIAVGGQFNEDDKRRVEMEATRYESVSALDLIAHLQEVGDRQQLDDGGNEALQAALDSLAAIQARVDVSDSKKVDLISFSSKTDVGEERMMLDLARREARLAIEERLNEESRAALGIGPRAELRGIINQRALLMGQILVEGEGGMSEKDAVFAKLKARRVAKAAILGAGVGIAGGLITQEIVAGIDPSRFGLIDAIRGEEATPHSDGLIHQTTLNSFLRGDETIVHTDAASNYEAFATAPNGSVELSGDHQLITQPDGTIDLQDPNGANTVEGLVVDANGTFDQASLDKLEAAGMAVEDNSFDEVIKTTTSEQVSVEQYIANHQAEATSVERQLWYANDTPGVYDNNEIAVYRGGSPDAPGIIDGGYQYSVAGMQPGGSWQGGESVDWNQAAASGNLFAAISATTGTQETVFMVPIGPDGAVNIPADSPAGQFFSNVDNAVQFNGAYMEIVQTVGVDADGEVAIRPLATLVGNESVSVVTDTVVTETTERHADYIITSAGYDTAQANFTEMAPITPIVSRRSLEQLRQPERGGYYDGEVSDAEREQIIREISPRLAANPNAELNPREEVDWFRAELVNRRGQNYVTRLEDFVRNNPDLQRVTSNLDSIVTIPVAAASESDTIFSTLSLFGQQDQEPGQQTTLLLNVNWLDTAQGDPDKVANIRRTLDEIQRARDAYPQLAIVVMENEYNEAEVNSTGGVIGYVVDDLVNASLITVREKMNQGVVAEDQDVLIVRSDADVRGQSRKHLANLTRAAREDKNLDIVKGVTRFGVAEQSKFPGFGIVSNFTAAVGIASSQENNTHTGGANFGVKATTLAAIGGLGDVASRSTGAGSDDVAIGQRIRVARGIGPAGAQGGYGAAAYGRTGSSAAGAIRRVKLVSGATIDTNPSRLIPYYLGNEWFQEAWGDSNRGFSAGPGGYASRDIDASAVESAEREDFSDEQVFRLIETNIQSEVRTNSEYTIRKTLSVFFGSVPGAYRIIGRIGEPNTRFVLTKAGRDFVRNRVERESNGRFGSYGLRKQRQLYGVTKPGAKRQAASATAPLVSPE